MKIKIVNNELSAAQGKEYYQQFLGMEFDRKDCFQYSEEEWCLPIPSKSGDDMSFWNVDELEFIE